MICPSRARLADSDDESRADDLAFRTCGERPLLGQLEKTRNRLAVGVFTVALAA